MSILESNYQHRHNRINYQGFDSKPKILCVSQDDQTNQKLSSIFTDEYIVLFSQQEEMIYRCLSNNDIDIVIMAIDINFNCIPMCRKIKRQRQHISVIAIDLTNTEYFSQAIIRAGADDVIRDLFNTDGFKKLLENRYNTQRAYKQLLQQSMNIQHPIADATSAQDDFALKLNQILIQQQNQTNWTVAELAQSLGLHEKSLYRKCKSVFKKSPHKLISSFRMQKAMQLMSSGEKLSSIAIECGFNDQSHFSRAFKREFGYTPRQHKASIQSL